MRNAKQGEGYADKKGYEVMSYSVAPVCQDEDNDAQRQVYEGFRLSEVPHLSNKFLQLFVNDVHRGAVIRFWEVCRSSFARAFAEEPVVFMEGAAWRATGGAHAWSSAFCQKVKG